jgi:hypothetical protein
MDTGLQTNLAIRDLEGDGAYTFYVANPGYWPIRGTVALENGGAVVDLTTGGRIDARLEGEMTVVPVALEPYGISAYRVDDARAKVVSWGTNPVAKDDLTHMREILDRAESLLTDPRVVKALPEGDRKLVRDSIESARADLADGQYARAWSTITHWRFWTLVRQEMERAAAVSPQ